MTKQDQLIERLHKGPLYQCVPITGPSPWLPFQAPTYRINSAAVQQLAKKDLVNFSEMHDDWFGNVKKCVLADGTTPEPENETEAMRTKFLSNFTLLMANAIETLGEGPLYEDRSNGQKIWRNATGTKQFSNNTINALLGSRKMAKYEETKEGEKVIVLAGGGTPLYPRDSIEPVVTQEPAASQEKEELLEEQEENAAGQIETPSNEECTGVTVLIDSENIANVWMHLLNRLTEEDRVIVFFTENSAHLSYQSVFKIVSSKNLNKIEWIECCTGTNALDFQLSTVLGSIITEDRYEGRLNRQYYILSKDKGYNAIETFWRKKKVNVIRTGHEGEIRVKTKKAEEEPVVPTEEPSQKEEAQKTQETKRGIDLYNEALAKRTWKERLTETFALCGMKKANNTVDYIVELGRIISVTDEERFVNALKAQFETDAARIWKEIQEDEEIIEQLLIGQYSSKKVRRKNYVSLFLRSNPFSEPDLRALSPLLVNPEKLNWPGVKRIVEKNHRGKMSSQRESEVLVATMKKHIPILLAIY